MKNLNVISLLIAIAVLAGCQNQETEKEQIVIQGEILNPPSDSPLIISKGSMKDTIELDSSNHFTWSYSANQANYFRLKIRRQEYNLYAFPNDTLHLTLDGSKNKDAMEFTGGKTAASEYLLAYRKMRFGHEWFNSMLRNDSVEQFIATGKQVQDSLVSVLDSYRDKLDDKRFFEIERDRIRYLLGMNKINYSRYYKFMNKISIPDSVTFHAFVNELPLENPKMLESQTYMQYLKNAFSYFNTEEPTEEEQKNYLGDTKFKLRSIKSVIEDPQIANALYYETLMDYANYQGFTGLEKERTYLKENLNDSNKLAKMENLYAVWEKISPGKQAPGFTYPTATGDSVSLSDYRGKLVYIDVWATWCGPCMRELPYLDTLYQEYKGSELVILSVSVDERRQQWIDFLEEDEPGWEQLYTGGWDCSICDDYHIQGIPRFLLIDRDGTIITTSAPRPSSDEIRPLLDKHLNVAV